MKMHTFFAINLMRLCEEKELNDFYTCDYTCGQYKNGELTHYYKYKPIEKIP